MATEDERAMFLMDKLFRGRARTVEDVQKEFRDAGIPAALDYIKWYGLHTTKKKIDGYDWVYRFQFQLQKIKDEKEAREIVVKELSAFRFLWEDIPIFVFDRFKPEMRSRISDFLKYEGAYICGEDSDWDRQRCKKGKFVDGFKELRVEDRNWLLGNYGEIAWMVRDEDMELGDIDGGMLWKLYNSILRTRVTEGEFLRCVELVNMYESLELKVIFKGCTTES